MALWDRDVMFDPVHRAVGSYLTGLAVAEIRRRREADLRRSIAGEQSGANEAPSPWRTLPPTADEVRGGMIHWWIKLPNHAKPWPVELVAIDAMIFDASGLGIASEGAQWAPCIAPA